jgi:hypothetical protein
MSVYRSNAWKQDTPRMQMVSLLQSVWGNISNIKDMFEDHGVFQWHKLPEPIRTAMTHLEEAQTILKQMPEGAWDISHKTWVSPTEPSAYAKLCIKRLEEKRDISVTNKPSRQVLKEIRAHFHKDTYDVELYFKPTKGTWDNVDECYVDVKREYFLRLVFRKVSKP